MAQNIQMTKKSNYTRFTNKGDYMEKQPTRDMETRETFTRSANFKLNSERLKRGKLYFPKELIPDGMVYGRIPLAVMGKPEESRINEAMYVKGWSRVPENRHPGWEMVVGDMAMFERPVELHEEEKQIYYDTFQKPNDEQISYVTGVGMPDVKNQVKIESRFGK